MGRIFAPHGIKGWVKLKVFTETPSSLLDYPVWWLSTSTGWQKHKVAEAKWHDSGLAARLEGFNDRTAAEALKGAEVGIPRAEFPEPEEGEYYWADLVGLEVVNKQNELLGVVESLIETGANDVLVVRGDAPGDNATPSATSAPPRNVERLIPYLDTVVVSVDLLNRRIIVDWGLDY
jgi:16S rRNA processing protein RimM